MNITLELLKLFGLEAPVDGTQPFLAYIFWVFSVSVLGVLCFLNILICFLVIWGGEDKRVQDFLERWPVLKRIANVYRRTTFMVFIMEVAFLMWIFGFLIFTSLKILSAFN